MKQSKAKKSIPLSLRLSEDVEKRLTHCAELLKLPKHTVAQNAIEAAVEAIEANGGRIVFPLTFTTTHEAVAKRQAPTVTQTGPEIYHLSGSEPEGARQASAS